MGDVLTLIEKAEAAYSEAEAQKAQEILEQGRFTLEDFLEQMQQIKKMGPLQNVLGMMPGIPKEMKQAEIDDGELARIEAIIRSMTPEERVNPKLINGSRRSRISRGSGTTSTEVNQLLKQFKQVQQMMQGMGLGAGGRKGKKGKKGKRGKGPRPGGLPAGFPPELAGGMPSLPGTER
jgi:signal recognition particle subunit SRP54